MITWNTLYHLRFWFSNCCLGSPLPFHWNHKCFLLFYLGHNWFLLFHLVDLVGHICAILFHLWCCSLLLQHPGFELTIIFNYCFRFLSVQSIVKFSYSLLIHTGAGLNTISFNLGSTLFSFQSWVKSIGQILGVCFLKNFLGTVSLQGWGLRFIILVKLVNGIGPLEVFCWSHIISGCFLRWHSTLEIIY